MVVLTVLADRVVLVVLVLLHVRAGVTRVIPIPLIIGAAIRGLIVPSARRWLDGARPTLRLIRVIAK